MHTIHEEILSYMILTENEGQVGYPMLKEAAKISWYGLFKKTKESIVRKWYPVENGIVKYPASLENLLGVYVCNASGELSALYEDNFKSIIDKLKPKSSCKCNTVGSPPVYKNVVVDEVRAVGYLIFSDIGSLGDKVEIFIRDPIRGLISIGSYIQETGDTLPVFTAKVTAALSLNNYGYEISATDGRIKIVAPAGLGASINGGNRITIVVTEAAGIFDDTFDNTFN